MRQEEAVISPAFLLLLTGRLRGEGEVDSQPGGSSLRDCPCHACDIFHLQAKPVHETRLASSCFLSIEMCTPRAPKAAGFVGAGGFLLLLLGTPGLGSGSSEAQTP